MDTLPYDNYSYSDASTPRTPSPRTSVCSADDVYSSPHFKAQNDVPVVAAIYDRADDDADVEQRL